MGDLNIHIRIIENLYFETYGLFVNHLTWKEERNVEIFWDGLDLDRKALSVKICCFRFSFETLSFISWPGAEWRVTCITERPGAGRYIYITNTKRLYLHELLSHKKQNKFLTSIYNIHHNNIIMYG